MIKNNKFKLFISSLVTLLPILAGLFLWDKLPDQMVTHWGANGLANGWSGKAFAIFVVPLIMLVLHWFCVFFTSIDPKNKEQSKKVFGMTLWICPILSLLVNGIIYFTALGKTVNMTGFLVIIMGLSFVLLGNYLPKCKQNSTIGIKIKWTLANEENWNATHRFAGKLWFIGGIFLMLCLFLPEKFIISAMMIIMAILVIIPIIYSWLYYKKQVAAGTAPKKAVVQTGKAAKIISIVVLSGIAILIAVLLFTGNVDVKFAEKSFTVEASYWNDITVNYDIIDSIEYREECEVGSRTYGYASPRLLLGSFKNDEFGNYTRYSYTSCKACVIIEDDGEILVIGGKDAKETKNIYSKLKAKTDK